MYSENATTDIGIYFSSLSICKFPHASVCALESIVQTNFAFKLLFSGARKEGTSRKK